MNVNYNTYFDMSSQVNMAYNNYIGQFEEKTMHIINNFN